MVAQLANKRPFDGFEQWKWEWLRADLSVAQIEHGLTEAFEYNPNPSHSLVFHVLDAARRRIEHGLPPSGKLWEEPSETLHRSAQAVTRVLQRLNPARKWNKSIGHGR